LNVQISERKSLDGARLDDFVKSIDSVLLEQGRQWIFIFDQVNDIFGRWNSRKFSHLPFPFYFMRIGMKRHRITSIISATADNKSFYCEIHDDFIEYNHRLCFDEQEIRLFYSSFDCYSEETKAMLMAKTGGVPLQINNLISKHSTSDYILDFETFEEETIDSICHELDKLKKESVDFKKISEQACCCVLSISDTGAYVYDRKYSIFEKPSIKPVFPLVLDAYAEYFWEELLVECGRFRAHI